MRYHKLSSTMSLKLAVVFALFAVCLARPDTLVRGVLVDSFELHDSQESDEDFAAAHYNFNSVVQNAGPAPNFGVQESRDENRIQGSYFVHLPDGRIQKVTYYVDGDSGFVADVSYEDPNSSEELVAV
ncbi:uncharacterized protein LOC143036629 [Oratosquilla oratoria]|uniref:uncharacterized protein LOC143036629 n=1 Tax=Oratosquilla oratoria TaxID=337810 RepID=UPI003F765FDF